MAVIVAVLIILLGLALIGAIGSAVIENMATTTTTTATSGPPIPSPAP